MSGLEIILIIGAGILIHKKVEDRKKKKELLRRAELGQGYGQAELMNPNQPRSLQRNQQVPVTRAEEALPLYVPDQEQEKTNVGIDPAGVLPPSYEEANQENASRLIANTGVDRGGTAPQATFDEIVAKDGLAAAIRATQQEPRSNRWRDKLFGRESMG